MIEVHPTPSEAAVDPLQPLDYRQFGDLVHQVHRVQKVVRG
jgi:3-deoxy-D-arabino-heptulosonate 7-phosphate (DAHP) synthase